MYSIHVEKSTAHAVSPVRKTRLLYFDRRRGVWLQNRSWDAAQAGRHALDRQGRQRHHRPALQQAQRTLPGFLGTPLRAKAGGCMTSLNLMCAPTATPSRAPTWSHCPRDIRSIKSNPARLILQEQDLAKAYEDCRAVCFENEWAQKAGETPRLLHESNQRPLTYDG